MTEQRVYMIELKNIGDVLATRDRLGRKITVLSDAVKEPVYFLSCKDLTDKRLILLECSKGFLDRFKGEYFIENLYELGSYYKTERSPELQRYFENAAPPPAPTYKKPKFGP